MRMVFPCLAVRFGSRQLRGPYAPYRDLVELLVSRMLESFRIALRPTQMFSLATANQVLDAAFTVCWHTRSDYERLLESRGEVAERLCELSRLAL